MEDYNEISEENTIINLQALNEFSGNCEATVKGIIRVFLEQAPKQIATLSLVVAQKDWNNVKALSHKIKSSYAIIGADSVKNLLEKMETDCMQSNVDETKLNGLLERVIVLNEKVIESISANIISV
ncbi:MAG TPA: Hpt domain-containing protein [Ohtaekwangia sp.]|nr:Hpt domain-containing protein [Ohtaekwangia sp.]